MSTLNFAEVHYMIAFLSKPTESSGFEQIIDFFNAHPIKYALTVNLKIYTSCVKQFWATAKVKNINGETQLHGKDRLKLKELMELYTKVSDRVLNLETIKTAQAKEIQSLKKRVKRLEKEKSLRTHRLKTLYKVRLSARVESSTNKESLGEEDASKQGRISNINANQDIYLVNVHSDEDIFGVMIKMIL
nr:hypothetical protein [Tanacetum cinerariifolium]